MEKDQEIKVIEGEVIQQGATSRPIDMESLMAMAVTKGGIEVLERLMVIRREMKEEYAKEQFFIALSKFQSEINTIQKTKPVNNYDGTLRYMYAPIESIIEQVKDALHKNGFSYTITPEQPEGKVITICEAHHISGYTKTTRCEVPISAEKGMNAIQHVGEAKSYSKRYAFCDAFGIVTGDGDTDASTVPEQKKEEPKKEQPKAEKPPVDPDLLNLQKKVNDTLKAKFADCDVRDNDKLAIFFDLYGKARGSAATDYDKKSIKSALDIANPKILVPLLKLCEDFKL